MNLTINREKLKLRHYLNIQKLCKNYPTEEDYLYELITALEYNEMINEPFGTTFTRRNLSMFDKDPKTHERHLEILEKLTSQGILECVEEGGIRLVRFKLKSHPWIKTNET